ncbi:MAG: tetratricopeptide repeat protein [Bdellovibrionia bacterium]
MKRTTRKNTMRIAGALALASLSCVACSSVRGIFAADTSKEENKPISNPFGDYEPTLANNADPADTMIFRSKNGNKAVEVELSRANQGVTDFVLPVSGGSASRAPASAADDSAVPAAENAYANLAPTRTDRELTRKFSQAPFEDEQKRSDIEKGLGLVQSEEMTPERQKSYLASMDHIKQLYRMGRYEAGLIEVDSMIHDFPTDPKLHEMKGTLLDRVGRRDLALKSWGQALRFNPGDQTLRRFIERRGGRIPAASPSSSGESQAEVTP